MKKILTLATAGLLLVNLQGARAQREVEPPAVPPLLEGQRPLAQPDTREPVAPKQAEEGKAKPKAKGKPKVKAGKKASKKAAATKESPKKTSKVLKKKGQKNQKKKRAEAGPN